MMMNITMDNNARNRTVIRKYVYEELNEEMTKVPYWEPVDRKFYDLVQTILGELEL